MELSGGAPDISKKSGLPKELWNKIKFMCFECPLCEYFCDCNSSLLGRCPLLLTVEGENIDCFEPTHPYRAWFHASLNKERKEAATAIVKLLEAALEKEAGK
jgi:hypothetical protein